MSRSPRPPALPWSGICFSPSDRQERRSHEKSEETRPHRWTPGAVRLRLSKPRHGRHLGIEGRQGGLLDRSLRGLSHGPAPDSEAARLLPLRAGLRLAHERRHSSGDPLGLMTRRGGPGCTIQP